MIEGKVEQRNAGLAATGVHLGILRREVHRSGDEEGVVAAGDRLVEAALHAQVGAEHLQVPERLQAYKQIDRSHREFINKLTKEHTNQLKASTISLEIKRNRSNQGP